jgi:uncharacterized protein
MDRPGHTDILKIRVSGLSNGIHEYDFTADPAEIHLDTHFTDPVKVHAVLDKTPGQLYLKAEIQTEGHFVCDRCVETFTQPVFASYNVFFVFQEPASGSREPEEVQVISPDTVHVDLTEDVRQMVTLSVPLKLLCKEECKGLCPHCGANRNERSCDCKEEQTDPRWEGLQGLLKN